MKISKETIEILKNFAEINSNLLINKGKAINTISSALNIQAKANVAEKFPVDITIYDLNQFLGTLGIVDEGDVEFGEKSMTIKGDKNGIEYYYAAPSIIPQKVKDGKDKVITVNSRFDFDLSSKDLATIQKAAAIFSAPKLSIIGKDKKVTLVIGDPSTPSSNNYQRILGETEEEFSYYLSMENLRVVPDSYKVSLGSKKFIHFKATKYDLQYWLAVDPSSVV
jgi:hypothetical protein